MTLEQCRQFLGGHLEEIADVLPRDYRLTFIARNTAAPHADIVVTDDDITLATEAAKALVET